MPDEVMIIAILKRIEYTAFTIQPYVAKKTELPYIIADERITNLNVQSLAELPQAALQLFKLSEEIEPHALLGRFTKKKVTTKEFFSNNERLLSEVVHPFIDARLYAIIELLLKSAIPLYDAQAMPHLYPTDQIIIEQQKAHTTLNFDRKETGTIYRLEVFTGKTKIDLQSAGNYLLTNNPCTLYHNNKLIHFEPNITGKILTPFLQKKFIEIPKRLEFKYFSSFITRLVNNSEIIAGGFTVKDVQITPAARVSLEKNWQDEWCLILKFKYGEKIFPADNSQKNVTELKADEQGFAFYRSKRNKTWENEKKSALKQTGLLQFDNCFKLFKDGAPADFHAYCDWLTENSDTLVNLGFETDEVTARQYVFSKPAVKQAVLTGNDWFDVKIIVLTGGFEIPFAMFRNNILNRKREYLLPDGKLFLIPASWFEQYHDLLIHSVSVEGNLRLNKHHFTILRNLDIDEVESLEEITSKGDIKVPKLTNVTLRPYQITGFSWMVQLTNMGFGGILADDMGLGKTLQTISLLAHYYHGDQIGEQNLKIIRNTHTGPPLQLSLFDQPTDPLSENSGIMNAQPVTQTKADATLIVMPASLIHNWVNELNHHAPFLKKLVYTGTSRKKLYSIFKKYQIVLTTYGTLRNDIDFFSGYRFAYAILDESQQIKNPSSLTAQAVFSLNAEYRFVLTGTPVENNLTDLWSQMNFVNPGLLGDQNTFSTYYASPLSRTPTGIESERLLSMIQPFILRRTKESVAPELPELTEIIQYCNMTEEQAELYESEKSKIRNLVLEQIEGSNMNANSMLVLKALMQLRQIANHPLMVDKESQVGSGKFEEITSRLETIIAEKHRVLIFSSFVKHLSIIEQYCKIQGIGYTMLTGSTTNREKVISIFKNETEKSVFLISLKAGGVGLNLTEAGYVFMLDPWWNPAAEMQAVNRAHRIGQSKNVFVYRFITRGTIEEKIITLQQKKRELADAFIRPQNAIAGMSREEIMKLFE